ncbi:hypothetical protein [Leptospira adleri]|uniref:hypothetical protein n=1 Tax=Leptospira adleri TaxID=2023186 RepID=UPI001083C683|nr:hypothetical protein [Leptospira adleri]TGM58508.1 hypothetical protein EHQ97_05265 [Leptospira adleri]
MTDNQEESSIGVWAVVFYFLSSLFTAGTIADHVAEAIVDWREVSNFEGASGFAYAFQLPVWFIIAFILLWILFLFIRKQPALVYSAILIYFGVSIPFIIVVLDLLGVIS